MERAAQDSIDKPLGQCDSGDGAGDGPGHSANRLPRLADLGPKYYLCVLMCEKRAWIPPC